MKSILKLMILLPLGAVSTSQAGTTFLEGSRDAVPLHPSCRTENTGLTAVGLMLPNGPEINVSIDKPGKKSTPSAMSLPLPQFLYTKDRKGNMFNANPIMSATPSYSKAGIFGMDTIKATVPKYGSKDKTEDTRMVFWKLKEVNAYDVETNTLMKLPYIPVSGFLTVDLGFAAPKFTPESCLVSMNVRGTQVARCDQIDPATHTIIAGSKPDIRTKRMRLIIERDLMKNPLPAHCGDGIKVTVQPTEAEAKEIEAKMLTLTP